MGATHRGPWRAGPCSKGPGGPRCAWRVRTCSATCEDTIGSRTLGTPGLPDGGITSSWEPRPRRTIQAMAEPTWFVPVTVAVPGPTEDHLVRHAERSTRWRAEGVKNVYTRVYVYMYACVCVCTCINACVRTHMHTHVYACIKVYRCIGGCVLARMCVCVEVYVYTCACISPVHTHTHTAQVSKQAERGSVP